MARAGQIARAATRLGVDATTVGRRIRRLEAGLGQTLFERTRTGQTLTESGDRLLGDVEAMERAALRLASHASAGAELAGTIRISTSEGFGIWLVAEQLAAFSGAYPGLTVDLAATNGFLSPSKRETDVAILLARPRSGMLRSKKLADYRLRLYAGIDYLAAHGPIAGRDDLQHHPLIGYIPDLLDTPELRYLDEVMPGLTLRLRSSSITAQHRMAAAGAGIAVLPCFIGDADPGIARVLPEVVITRSFWVVTHQDTSRLARVRAFVEWITDLAATHRARLLG